MRKIVILIITLLFFTSCKKTYQYSLVIFEMQKNVNDITVEASKPHTIEASNDEEAMKDAEIYFLATQSTADSFNDNLEYFEKNILGYSLFNVNGVEIKDSIITMVNNK